MPDDFIEHFTSEVMDFQLFESGVIDAIRREVAGAVRQTLRTKLSYDYDPATVNWAWICAELGLPPDTPVRHIALPNGASGAIWRLLFFCPF